MGKKKEGVRMSVPQIGRYYRSETDRYFKCVEVHESGASFLTELGEKVVYIGLEEPYWWGMEPIPKLLGMIKVSE